ncbi:MAG: glutamate racemase [Propionibacteriaceae bacterium]|uniref:Glutamate racemase n=1 Tax=Propionibacterium ruminifibrarum TaxID=1962131 RepID=A0A375I2C7_9ACTN|nr:glutamate racemase [Propionibacteriaceae bacterium]SPF68971.1 Glutamate racemase [Propionibacterium ruminifibrarum]
MIDGVLNPELDAVTPPTPDAPCGEGESKAPIGVFDSGFGGLTVARAVVDLLPHEDIIYLGDTARAPYGPRPIAQVRGFVLEALDDLVSRGVKALVIACNTGSAAALRDARERYDVPVIEVVVPAARKAAGITRNNRVGVICTQATASSLAYDDALGASPVQLVTQVCPKLVEYVEEGITTGPEILATVRDYLAPLQQAGIDTLVLGCTHYPLLSGVISYVMGEQVALVSSSDECARTVFAELTRLGLLRDDLDHEPVRQFITTGDAERFQGLGRRLMGSFVDQVRSTRIG